MGRGGQLRRGKIFERVPHGLEQRTIMRVAPHDDLATQHGPQVAHDLLAGEGAVGERLHEIPAGQPIVVHCEGGYRSAIAASLLQKLGRKDVHDMVGGYKAWLAAKLPA